MTFGYQGASHLILLTPCGTNPTSEWTINGHIKKHYDKELKGYFFTCAGSTNTSLSLPKSSARALGITQGYVIVQCLLDEHVPCSIEISIKDGGGTKRRLLISSAFREMGRNPLHAQLPLSLSYRGQWINLCFDLQYLMKICFPTQSFRTLDGIKVSGACHIRRIFTMRNAPHGSVEDMGKKERPSYESTVSLPSEVEFPMHTTLKCKTRYFIPSVHKKEIGKKILRGKSATATLRKSGTQTTPVRPTTGRKSANILPRKAPILENNDEIKTLERKPIVQSTMKSREAARKIEKKKRMDTQSERTRQSVLGKYANSPTKTEITQPTELLSERKRVGYKSTRKETSQSIKKPLHSKKEHEEELSEISNASETEQGFLSDNDDDDKVGSDKKEPGHENTVEVNELCLNGEAAYSDSPISNASEDFNHISMEEAEVSEANISSKDEQHEERPSSQYISLSDTEETNEYDDEVDPILEEKYTDGDYEEPVDSDHSFETSDTKQNIDAMEKNHLQDDDKISDARDFAESHEDKKQDTPLEDEGLHENDESNEGSSEEEEDEVSFDFEMPSTSKQQHVMSNNQRIPNPFHEELHPCEESDDKESRSEEEEESFDFENALTKPHQCLKTLTLPTTNQEMTFDPILNCYYDPSSKQYYDKDSVQQNIAH